MGATERRERHREELREQILREARKIVTDQGYAALTMRRIAEAVEYSPAAIYQYFENRDAIATALMEEGFVQLNGRFERALSIADPRARLEALAREYVRFGMEHAETYRLMFMEDPQITASLLEHAQRDDAGTQAYAALVAPFVVLREAGQLRADVTPQAAADTLWVTLHGLVGLKLTCPMFPATPTEELLHTAIASLLRGFLTS